MSRAPQAPRGARGAREPRALAGHLRRHGHAADGAVHRDVRDEPGRREEVQRAQGRAWPPGFGQSDLDPWTARARSSSEPGDRDVPTGRRRPVAGTDVKPEEQAEVAEALASESDRSARSASTPSAEAEVDRLEALPHEARRGAARQEGPARRRPAPRSTSAAWWSAWSRGTWSSRPNLAEPRPRGRRVRRHPRPGARASSTNRCRSTGTPTRCRCKPKYFPTDWELSAARAVTVLRHLNERAAVPNDADDRGRVRPRPAAGRPVQARVAGDQQAGRHRRRIRRSPPRPGRCSTRPSLDTRLPDRDHGPTDGR